MQKGILSSVLTFLVLLIALFAGMVIEDEFQFLSEEKEEISEKEEEKEIEDYEPVLDHEKAVIEVTEKSIPAVVSIISSRYVERSRFPFGDFFSFPQDETERQEEKGTGFIVSQNGLILTNRHVVEDERAEYTVFLSTGEEKEADVLARDPVHDLALLKIEGEDFPMLELGDSRGIRLGQTAIAIGNALGELENTVSSGIISGLGRRVTAQGRRGAEVLDDVIQTDAAINLGNSGGPLLNLEGKVVGVNTATAVYAEGIGFAIPSNKVKRFIEEVKEHGEIFYPFLGIRYIMVNEEVQKEKELPVGYGALIIQEDDEWAVKPDSAADKAGLREGDIILEFDGEKITKDNHLASIIIRYYPEDTVKLKILRDGMEETLEVTLGKMD